MKLSNLILMVGAGLTGFSVARKVLDKYQVGIYYYDKEEAAEQLES